MRNRIPRARGRCSAIWPGGLAWIVPDDALRQHLLDLLHGGNAHVTFDDAVNGFPEELAGVRPEGAPHSAWELVEHMRIG